MLLLKNRIAIRGRRLCPEHSPKQSRASHLLMFFEMNKSTITLILIPLLLLFGTACQKEVALTPDTIQPVEKLPDVLALEGEGEESGIEIDPEMLYASDGVLVFRTVEYYESIVDDFTPEEDYVPEEGEPEWVQDDGSAEEAVIDYVAASDHISYGSLFDNGVSEFGDPYIDAILNQDRIVQIGAWLFRLDWNQRKVFVISYELQGAYNALLNGIGPDVMIFSMEDDVLAILRGEEDPSLRGCGGVGGIDDDFLNFQPEIGGIVRSVNLYAFYRKYGIYFKLGARLDNTDLGISASIIVEDPEAWCRIKPCRKNKTKSASPGNKTGNPIVYAGIQVNPKWTLYSGSRGLNGYNFFVSALVAGVVPPGTLLTHGFQSRPIGRAVNYNP